MTDFAAFMSGWGWVAYSVAGAAFSAGSYLVTQYYRQPGAYLVFWSRLAIVLLLAGFAPGMDLPENPLFYGVVAATVACAILADVRTFDVIAKYGAGVTARLGPLSVWGAFFIWFLFDPGLLGEYAARPLNTAVILAALGGCVFFAGRQAKCEITGRALAEMLPALAGYSITVALNKYAMGLAELQSASFSYMFLQSALSVPFLGVILLWRRRADGGTPAPVWRTKGMLVAALLVAAFWIVSMSFKNYAVAFTENPSYQAAVGLTMPLFISLYYIATGHKEKADVKSGLGIVACAMILALATVRH